MQRGLANIHICLVNQNSYIPVYVDRHIIASVLNEETHFFVFDFDTVRF